MPRFAAASWILAMALPAMSQAGSLCPPPPNPNGCPLELDRSTLMELDADMDGQPDNTGSTGSFCAGNSPADCTGQLGSEVGFDLVVSDPSVQDVTCTTQGVGIWIMSAGCGGCLASGIGSVSLPAGTTNETDLRVVVSDVNGDICPCGGSVTCTFSVEVECEDGADGDGDGLVDGADPDCCLDNDDDGVCGTVDCDDSNPIVHQTPAAVADLHVAQSAFETQLSWDVPPGDWVDVVSGSLADLTGAGEFTLATCLIDDATQATATDPRAAPPSGDGYYYLARAQNACGDGSYGVPGAVPRGDLDSLAPCGYDPECPGCPFCDLQDPPPVCSEEQCLASFGFPPTVCDGPTGAAGQGQSCSSPNDCLPGFTCRVDPFGAVLCLQWCRVAFQDCPASVCAPLFPPLIIAGTEYGVCF